MIDCFNYMSNKESMIELSFLGGGVIDPVIAEPRPGIPCARRAADTPRTSPSVIRSGWCSGAPQPEGRAGRRAPRTPHTCQTENTCNPLYRGGIGIRSFHSSYQRSPIPGTVIRLVDERGLLRPKPPPADPAPEPGRGLLNLQFGFHPSLLLSAGT